MKITLILFAALIATSETFADSLYDTLSRREEAARNEIAAERRAREMAQNGARFNAYLATSLGMPNASVVNEGWGGSFYGDSIRFNVGGVWGCNSYIQEPSHGIDCINAQTGQHRHLRGI